MSIHRGNRFHVTMADAFHPSSAGTAVNPAWRPEDDDGQYHPGSPTKTSESKWTTVWAEAIVLPSGGGDYGDPKKESHAVPVASPSPPEAVFYDETSADHSGSSGGDGGAPPPALVVADPSGNPDWQKQGQPEEDEPPPSHPCRNGHCMDILIGSCIALSAVGTTYGLEIAAVTLYLVASLFYRLAKWSKEAGGVFLFFFAIFLLVTTIALFVDSILLAVSVFVSELLAMIALLVCCLFGGPKVACGWRQYIRRICHLTRWAFRDFHSDWMLQRSSLAFLQVADKIDSTSIPASAVLVDEDAAPSVATETTASKKEETLVDGI